MKEQQIPMDVNVLLSSISEDIAKLVKEKAILQSKLHTYQSVVVRMDAEIKELKGKTEAKADDSKKKPKPAKKDKKGSD